jgi:hypothetical protein
VCEKAASPRRAAIIARALLPMVRGVEPIVVNGKCKVCGAYVRDSYTAAMHVRSRHADIVEKVVSRIVEELRRRVRV